MEEKKCRKGTLVRVLGIGGRQIIKAIKKDVK